MEESGSCESCDAQRPELIAEREESSRFGGVDCGKRLLQFPFFLYIVFSFYFSVQQKSARLNN